MEQFETEITIPDQLPLLPVRDIVVFPYMVIPLYVGRDQSIASVNEALNEDRLIFLACQKDPVDEEPEADDIYEVGTVAVILRMLKMPDNRIKLLVQGIKRGRIVEHLESDEGYRVQFAEIEDMEEEENPESEALLRHIKEQLAQAVTLGKPMLPDLVAVIESIEEAGKLADIIVSNLGLKVDEAQEVLELEDPIARLKKK